MATVTATQTTQGSPAGSGPPANLGRLMTAAMALQACCGGTPACGACAPGTAGWDALVASLRTFTPAELALMKAQALSKPDDPAARVMLQAIAEAEKPPINWPLWIALGLGVAAVGGGAYYYAKRRR